MAKPKLPKVKITEAGVQVALGNEESPYWILFSTDKWTLLDRQQFLTTTPLGRLRMVIERAVDWSVPNSKWEPIPFDQEKLLAQIASLEGGTPTSEEFRAAANLVVALYGREADSEETSSAVETLRGLVERRNLQAEALSLEMPAQLNMPLQMAFWQGLNAVENLPFLSK